MMIFVVVNVFNVFLIHILQIYNLNSRYLIGEEKSVKAVLKQPIPEPQLHGEKYLQFEGYWVKTGYLEPKPPSDYILTDSVRKNLRDLVRVVSIGKLPVLLQVTNIC